uniref:Cryptochrome 3 n=1 Tax=Nothobranchius kadleci TaxID=1051664 RepID=A0A1A8CET0_NOTKA
MVVNSVHWFRKGLRLHDNPALQEALNGADTVRCVYILDPWFAGAANVGINRWRFLLEALEDLDSSLKKLNSRLFVVRGQPTDVFPRLFKEWNVTRLTLEYDPEPYGKERDGAIIKMAQEFGVETAVRNSHTLYNLDRLLLRGRNIIQSLNGSQEVGACDPELVTGRSTLTRMLSSVSGLLASVPTIQEEAEPPMTDESQTSSGPDSPTRILADVEAAGCSTAPDSSTSVSHPHHNKAQSHIRPGLDPCTSSARPSSPITNMSHIPTSRTKPASLSSSCPSSSLSLCPGILQNTSVGTRRKGAIRKVRQSQRQRGRPCCPSTAREDEEGEEEERMQEEEEEERMEDEETAAEMTGAL